MIEWRRISTVFLDMDGTLLDLHFDNHFWLEHVPVQYAGRHGLKVEDARQVLGDKYRAITGTLDWYCIDYWSNALELDIVALKRDVEHLIAIRPGVEVFLQALRNSEKKTFLVTNAHQKSLSLKMEHTGLEHYFDGLICSHDLGLPKEDPHFWDRIAEVAPYERGETLLIDDSLSVLESARVAGIGHLLSILRPDSKQPVAESGDFASVNDFTDLLPIE